MQNNMKFYYIWKGRNIKRNEKWDCLNEIWNDVEGIKYEIDSKRNDVWKILQSN